MDNKVFLEVLRSKKEDIVVPDSLKPENFDKVLGKIEADNIISVDVKQASKIGKRKIAKRIAIAVAVAAVIIVALTVEPIIKQNIILHRYLEFDDNGIMQPKNYDELSKYLTANRKENNRVTFVEWLVDKKVMAEKWYNNIFYEAKYGASSSGSSQNTFPSYVTYSELGSVSSGASYDYSDTNVRTEGVDEADWLKTDGEYIYVLDEGVLDIYKAAGENTEYIGRTEIAVLISENETYGKLGSVTVADMLLFQDKLIILGESIDDEKSMTVVTMFDITNVTNVKLINMHIIDGGYEECKIYDEYLYVCTKYGIYNYGVEYIQQKIDGNVIDCSHMYVAEDDHFWAYYTISSFELNDTFDLADYVSILNDGKITPYVTYSNIYLISEKHFNESDTIGILKFEYKKGEFYAKAATNIEGWLDDVFCVDEYNDYLRMVVSVKKLGGNEFNSLIILDDNLVKTGEISNIAPGERIYSASFQGDVGYFVTYEETKGDPLFSVDLSDPKDPKILGELKMPGFSEYLYVWDKDRMFGIGLMANRVKLAMFNISDLSNVVEEDKMVLDAIRATGALEDHKDILIEPKKNIIGFDIWGVKRKFIEEEGLYDIKEYHAYCLYSYANGEFVEICELIAVLRLVKTAIPTKLILRVY